jgi:hypothetical protein
VTATTSGVVHTLAAMRWADALLRAIVVSVVGIITLVALGWALILIVRIGFVAIVAVALILAVACFAIAFGWLSPAKPLERE